MNTRLQVEHPITEQVTRVDLVRQQIQVAAGMEIEYKQEDLFQQGHSIEARVYAENPCENFMPSPGVVKNIIEPLGPGIRHDGYVYTGYEIPLFYDPMISKLIVTGKNREQAIERMKRALYSYKISGVRTNIRFLNRILESEDFASGNYNTQFIEKNEDFLIQKETTNKNHEDIAIAASFVHYLNNNTNGEAEDDNTADCKTSEWKSFGKRKGVMRL
jgi:acetyl-CoA carboxylase biotin carboxylase subunit